MARKKTIDLSVIDSFLRAPVARKAEDAITPTEDISYEKAYSILAELLSDPANIRVLNIRSFHYDITNRSVTQVFKVGRSYFYYHEGLAIIIFGEKIIVKGHVELEESLHRKFTALYNATAKTVALYRKINDA